MIGISIARVSSPSSGNWKAAESKVAQRQEARAEHAEDRNDGDQRHGEPDGLGADRRGQAREAARAAAFCREGRDRLNHAGPPSRLLPASMRVSCSLESVIATRMIAPMIILNA